MSEHADQESQENETPSGPTQEQLYDDLRRIGQLEDQKREIQTEIDERTQRLQDAIPALDTASLLYRLLSKAMPPQRAAKKRVPKKKPVKKK